MEKSEIDKKSSALMEALEKDPSKIAKAIADELERLRFCFIPKGPASMESTTTKEVDPVKT